MPHLEISLFGSPRVILGGTPITLSEKVLALLAYLVVESSRPHHRSTLTGLLWPEHPESTARNNLRFTLFKLRQTLGDQQAALPHILATRKTVQFNQEGDYWLDVDEFLYMLHARGSLYGQPDLIHVEEAVQLYRGGFLQGFFLGDNIGFEEWVMLTRERLHRQALDSLRFLTQAYLKIGDYSGAIRHASRQIELAPWEEESHQQLMLALALNGQRGAALAQFEACKQSLAEELGVEPGPETMKIYRRIQVGELEKIKTWAAPHSLPRPLPLQPNLPRYLTPFFGRKKRLAQLEKLLTDPKYPLLTIVGPGGVGKTRLALQAARRQVMKFQHGIFFVPLAGVESPAFLIPAIAQALDFDFAGRKETEAQLLDHLRQKEMLLVLDNFEHLLEGAALILKIIQNAPGVKILITSHEALRYQAEYVIRLKGLPVPERGNVQAATCASVQLFAERAARASGEFSLQADNQPDVIQICRYLDGFPLGIELAASWVGKLTCSEIVEAIQENLDFLVTSLRDVPARHRSLRAVFERSWQMLTREERRLLAQISVFRGGFQWNAARAVIGTQVDRELSSLVEKSLLRRTDTGRYEMHELLRQFAAEKHWQRGGGKKRDEDSSFFPHPASMKARHSAYYLSLAGSLEQALYGQESRKASRKMRTEIDNIREAWRWAITQPDFNTLDQGLMGLSRFYTLTGRYQEGEMMFGEAIKRARDLSVATGHPETKLVLGKLLAGQAHFFTERGLFDQAIASARQVVAQAEELPEGEGTIYLMVMGNLLWGRARYLQGEYKAAHSLLEQALSLAQDARSQKKTAQAHLEGSAPLLSCTLEADCLRNLGNYFYFTSSIPEAQCYFNQALHIYRATGDIWGESATLINLGVVSRAKQDYEAAISYYEKALQLKREIDDRQGQGMVLNNLGTLSLYQGIYKRAREYYKRSLIIRQSVSEMRGVATVLANLGQLAFLQGQYPQARSYYEQSLDTSRATGYRGGEGLALAHLSLLFHQLPGGNETARDYAQQALEITQAPRHKAYALTNLGHALADLGETTQASQAYQQALVIRRELGHWQFALEPLAGLARISLTQGKLAQAQVYVEEILRYLETSSLGHSLGEALESFRVHLTCYRVLQANHDPRCRELLEASYCALQAESEKIQDEKLRCSFLENVKANREIVETWEAMNDLSSSPTTMD